MSRTTIELTAELEMVTAAHAFRDSKTRAFRSDVPDALSACCIESLRPGWYLNLILQQGGEGKYEWSGPGGARSAVLGTGQVLVEATNVDCFKRASPDFRCLLIVLRAAGPEACRPWLQPALQAAKQAAAPGWPALAFLDAKSAARLRPHLEELAWEFRQQDVAFRSVARGRLELIKAELERQAAEQQATEAPERRHPVVFRAFQYYNENLHDRITLTNVARAVGLSPNRLLEVFREVGLQSPMACLRSMRMTRASALLQDRNLRVKEVAASVGYPSLAAFSRSYRKLYGLAPVESRRANGG